MTNHRTVHNPDEPRLLQRLSAELKAAKYGGYERPHLAGKTSP
jgi:hypothetical protein